jgi:hypothetical protein
MHTQERFLNPLEGHVDPLTALQKQVSKCV